MTTPFSIDVNGSYDVGGFTGGSTISRGDALGSVR